MNGFGTVFITSLRRSKALIAIAIAMSIGLVLIGILVTTQTEDNVGVIRVGVVDADNSALSKDFLRYLEDDLGMNVETSLEIDVLKTDLVEKRISAIIEVPKGLEYSLFTGNGLANSERIRLTVMGDYANEAFINAYLNSYTDSIRNLVAASGSKDQFHKLLSDITENGFSIKTKSKNDELLRMQSERGGFDAIIGLYEIISFLLAIGLCNMLYADRKGGTFERIRGSNVRAAAYTTAMGLVGVIISLLIMALPLILMSVANLNIGMPMSIIVLITFVYSLFIIAFGLFVGLCMPSLDSIVALIVIVATITSMLGGAFFPLDTVPEIFRDFALFTPQYWFSDIVNSYHEGEGHWVTNVVVILLMTAIFFILSGVRFVMKGTAKAV